MRRVALSSGPAGPVTARTASASPASVGDALALARSLEPLGPLVGGGSTLDVWEALATLGAHDLGAARAVEPHLDALAILRQAGDDSPGGTWGVFAAEAPGVRVTASLRPEGWLLDGVKPWCSLAGVLTDALVTAWVGDAERRLFRVPLDHEGVRVSDEPWHARGLTEIPSGSVVFSGAPAEPVGAAGWYLTRRGFAWGGMSVAACWFGGTVGVARTLLEAARQRPDDELLLLHTGRVDAGISEARRALADAAALVDAGDTASLRAKRVRATVARVAEDTLRSVGHALGPRPLVSDAGHAKRVADLEVYVRQHHGERDDVSLGRSVLATDDPW